MVSTLITSVVLVVIAVIYYRLKLIITMTFAMIPGKVSSWCPSSIWCHEYFGAHKPVKLHQQASSNKQGLFEIQKKENWKTCEYFHLLPASGEKTRASVVRSRCDQLGKGIQVFAFRVVPGTERGWWWWQLWFEHLSTFPWALGPSRPPIVRKPSSQTSAHVPLALLWRVSSDPP